MLLLDLADALKEKGQALETLFLGGLGHLTVHLGPFLVLAGGGGLQISGRIAQPAQLLEPELGMLLLIAGGLFKDGRDLLKALFLGLAGKVGVLVAGHALSGKRLPQIGLSLTALQFHVPVLPFGL